LIIGVAGRAEDGAAEPEAEALMETVCFSGIGWRASTHDHVPMEGFAGADEGKGVAAGGEQAGGEGEQDGAFG
jgi:hypothetical protein